jgi:chromosome segregation ATPase
MENGHAKVVADLKRELTQIATEKTVLEESITSIHEKHEMKCQEVKEYKDTLESKVGNVDRDVERFTQENKQLKAKIQSLQEQIRANPIGKQLANTKINLEMVVKENEAIKEMKDNLEMENMRKEEKMSHLQNDLKKLKKEVQEYHNRNEHDKLQISALNQTTAKLQEQVASLTNAKKILDEEVSKLKTEKEKSLKIQKNIKIKYDRALQMEEELKSTLSNISKERDNLFSQVQGLQKAASKKPKPKVKARGSKTSVEEEEDGIRDKMSELEEQLSCVTSDNDQLAADLGKLAEDKKIAEMKISQLEFRVEELQSMREVKHEGSEGSDTKLSAVIEENTSLMNQLGLLKDEKRSMETEYQEVKFQLDEVMMSLASPDNSMDRSEKESACPIASESQAPIKSKVCQSDADTQTEEMIEQDTKDVYKELTELNQRIQQQCLVITDLQQLVDSLEEEKMRARPKKDIEKEVSSLLDEVTEGATLAADGDS